MDMNQQGDAGDKTIAWIGYGLYAAALISGGICAIAAIILNYIKKDDCQSALVRSHISWQIGTFWRALVYGIILGIVSVILTITVVGILVVWIIWVLYLVWYIYRIAKGVIALSANRSI